jgi:hypothetical protein
VGQGAPGFLDPRAPIINPACSWVQKLRSSPGPLKRLYFRPCDQHQQYQIQKTNNFLSLSVSRAWALSAPVLAVNPSSFAISCRLLMNLPRWSARVMLRAIPPFLRHSTTCPSFWRSFASRRADLSSDDDLAAAREWLTKFNSTAIPRHVGEISFSRSGGPGGQNVNKSVPARNQTRAGFLAHWC